jgi:hypothetical protein
MSAIRSAAARQERNSSAKSWREILKTHPAAELFPLMSPEELKALAEDIDKNGLQVPIVIWESNDGQKYLLDGRNRLDALELNGDRMFDAKGRPSDDAPDKLIKNIAQIRSDDPYEYVIGANILRRHLTAGQKRELIGELLKATPGKSNRQIARTVKVDHKTVGSVRRDLEGRGEISPVKWRTDTQGRQQPASKEKGGGHQHEVGITLDRRDREQMHQIVFLLKKSIYEILRQAAFDSCYPHAGNAYMRNYTERITVYVKPGNPRKPPVPREETTAYTWPEWLDFTQQIWNMHPQDVHRKGGHPAPFPLKLPARLIALFTFGAVGNFPGETVLDPFCGTGTTCVAAKRMSRQFIGIDINPTYVEVARERVEQTVVGDTPILVVGTPIWATQAEAVEQVKRKFETIGREAGEAKHKRKTYGRKVPVKADA